MSVDFSALYSSFTVNYLVHFLLLMKKTYYTSLLEQLESDFGELPPKPLSLDKTDDRFRIVQSSGLGKKWFTFTRVSRLLFSGSSSHDPDITRIKAVFNDRRYGLIKLFSDFRSQFFECSYIVRLIIFMVVVLMAPLLLLMLFIVVIRTAFRIIKTPSIGGSALGFFSPITQGHLEIVIDPVVIRKSSLSPAAVVSHEYIHLLQYLDKFGSEKMDLDSDFRSNLRQFMKDEEGDSAFYHLSPNEIEARLHEVVLSYYRNCGELPKDYVGFISMICSAKILGSICRGILKRGTDGYDLPCDKEFDLRVSAPVRDLAINMGRFSDFSVSKRFICEAFPVSYANLLWLYGDRDSALSFFETVPTVQFYEQVYGLPGWVCSHKM